jgi:myosin heavy subunit
MVLLVQDIEGVNDAAEFKSVCSALADVGIDSVQQVREGV